MRDKEKRDNLRNGIYCVDKRRYFGVVGEKGRRYTYFFSLGFDGKNYNILEESLNVVSYNNRKLNSDWLLSMALVSFEELRNGKNKYNQKSSEVKKILKDYIT